MALFSARTWLGRIGTGLNKFVIGEKGADGKQTLTNAPDSVTQQGDVISADNLNNFESRILEAFTGQAEALWINTDYSYLTTYESYWSVSLNKALSNYDFTVVAMAFECGAMGYIRYKADVIAPHNIIEALYPNAFKTLRFSAIGDSGAYALRALYYPSVPRFDFYDMGFMPYGATSFSFTPDSSRFIKPFAIYGIHPRS